LFDGRLSEQYRKWILEVPLEFPQHTFIFLTKLPENLPKDWPDNCWVGVTITDGDDDNTPLAYFKQVKAAVKFISFEPLLHWWDTATSDMIAESLKIAGISWVVLGQCTPVRKRTMPKLEWIREIVQAADKTGVPVFLKDNLDSVLRPRRLDGQIETGLCTNYGHSLRQEFPKTTQEAR